MTCTEDLHFSDFHLCMAFKYMYMYIHIRTFMYNYAYLLFRVLLNKYFSNDKAEVCSDRDEEEATIQTY